MAQSKKNRWEARLSCDDHAFAESQRSLLGLSEAGYVRAALTSTVVVDNEIRARAVGLAGEILFGLEQLCACELSDIDVFGVRDRQRELVALLMKLDE